MAIKVILTPLFGNDSDTTALATAQALAERTGAHIDAMHVRADPRDMIPYIGEGMSGALIDEIVGNAEQQGSERAKKVRKSFDDWRAEAGIPLAEAASDGPSCGWTETVGRPDAIIARRGRLADLTVLSRPSGDDNATTATEVLEAALLESGRPILVAAAAPAKTLGNRIAIAWNGGAEASRAVAASLPLLAAAVSVTAITIGEPAELEANGAGLIDYLAWHDVKARLVSLEKSNTPVGEALLAAAESENADLMVMGAYTHSRLRELVFGGVTRDILGAAGLPVLMAH